MVYWGFFRIFGIYYKNDEMGRYYEDLDTLIELIKKFDKKKTTAEFILKLARILKDNPNKTISDAIKEAKKQVL